MTYRFFEETRLAALAKVPWSYARWVRWLPQIGDLVPDFRVDTTQGPLGFHAWAEGHWVVLFSHPSAFTSVCTTELASIAACHGDLEQRGVKVLGVSNSTVAELAEWCEDIERIFPVAVPFPMAADPKNMLMELFGMIHREHAADCAIRKSLIVGPDLKIRMILEYPVRVGRSVDELLRAIDALQTADAFNVAMPADWEKGQDCLLLFAGPGQVGNRAGLTWRRIRSYLQTVSDPWALLSKQGS